MSRRASPGWAAQCEERVKKIPNRELLEETIHASGGDDYDGCFTRNGEIEFSILQTELFSRLETWLGETK